MLPSRVKRPSFRMYLIFVAVVGSSAPDYSLRRSSGRRTSIALLSRRRIMSTSPRTLRKYLRRLKDPRINRCKRYLLPCNGLRSSNWPAWSRSPRGCTSPTGPARTWPARRSPTTSWTPSAGAPFGRSCTTWTCSRIAPATGGPPAWMPGSRSGPRRCSGATEMPSVAHAANYASSGDSGKCCGQACGNPLP
jgi:hypothetical protein